MFYKVIEFIAPVMGWSFIVYLIQSYEYNIDNYIVYSLFPTILIGLFYVFIIKKYLFPLVTNKINFWQLYTKIMNRINEI